MVQVNQGSLYPALHRLQQKAWLRAEWKQSETGREAKFYSLTPSGRRLMTAFTTQRAEGQLVGFREALVLSVAIWLSA